MADRLTQTEVAKLLGVHPATLVRWEKEGRTQPARRLVRNGRRVYLKADVERIKSELLADVTAEEYKALKKEIFYKSVGAESVYDLDPDDPDYRPRPANGE